MAAAGNFRVVIRGVVPGFAEGRVVAALAPLFKSSEASVLPRGFAAPAGAGESLGSLAAAPRRKDYAPVQLKRLRSPNLGIVFHAPVSWQELALQGAFLVVDPATGAEFSASAYGKAGASLGAWVDSQLGEVEAETPARTRTAGPYPVMGIGWNGLAAEYLGGKPGSGETERRVVVFLDAGERVVACAMTVGARVFAENEAIYKWLLQTQVEFLAGANKAAQAETTRVKEEEPLAGEARVRNESAALPEPEAYSDGPVWVNVAGEIRWPQRCPKCGRADASALAALCVARAGSWPPLFLDGAGGAALHYPVCSRHSLGACVTNFVLQRRPLARLLRFCVYAGVASVYLLLGGRVVWARIAASPPAQIELIPLALGVLAFVLFGAIMSAKRWAPVRALSCVGESVRLSFARRDYAREFAALNVERTVSPERASREILGRRVAGFLTRNWLPLLIAFTFLLPLLLRRL